MARYRKPVRQFVNSFRLFIAHWKKKHEPPNLVLKCSCGKKFAKRKHLKAHLKTDSKHNVVENQHVPNDEYTDPHDSLPYQYGNIEDRKNMKDIQKHIANELRKAEADKFKDKRHILDQSTSKKMFVETKS